MAVKDYNTDPDLNTSISGINIAEGCPPSGINNAIRQLMADVKAEKESRDSAQNAIDDAQDKAIRDEAAARESAVSALDAAAVHKSGAETIAGAKTFAATPKIEGSKPSLIFTNTALTKGTTPGADQSFVIELTDKSGSGAANRVGALANIVSTNNVARTELRAYEPVAGSSKNALLTVSFPAGGDPYGSAPSTPAGSKSNQIVTADFLAAQGGIGGLAKDMEDCDANTLLTPGFFYARSKSTNFPAVSNYYVQVFSVYEETQYIRQVCYRCGTVDSNDHNIWTRQIWTSSDSTVYGEWVQVMTSKGGVFTDAVTVSTSGNNYISIQGTSVPDVTSENNLPSASRLIGIKMVDVAGNTIGQCRTQRAANGTANTSVIAYSTDGKKNGSIAINYMTDGTFVGTAPTPAADSNTTHIATTEWCRARSRWAYKKIVLTTDGTIGERELDFTSYLPSDGEEYEVLMRVRVERSDNSGTNTVARIFLTSGEALIMVQADGSNWQQQSESCVFPVPASRKLKYDISGYASSNFEIAVYAYRKA